MTSQQCDSCCKVRYVFQWKLSMDRVQNCFSYCDSNNFQLNTPVLLPRGDLYHYTTEKIATWYYTTYWVLYTEWKHLKIITIWYSLHFRTNIYPIFYRIFHSKCTVLIHICTVTLEGFIAWRIGNFFAKKSSKESFSQMALICKTLIMSKIQCMLLVILSNNSLHYFEWL